MLGGCYDVSAYNRDIAVVAVEREHAFRLRLNERLTGVVSCHYVDDAARDGMRFCKAFIRPLRDQLSHLCLEREERKDGKLR